jgi:hypothetical protein
VEKPVEIRVFRLYLAGNANETTDIRLPENQAKHSNLRLK